MRSFFENKRLVLLLAALALGALTVLAISLNEIPFREAEHFATPEPQSVAAAEEPLPQVEFNASLWKRMIALSLIVLLVVLVLMLLSPKWRKRLINMLIRGLIWAAAIYFLLTNPVTSRLLLRVLNPEQFKAPEDQPGDEALARVPEFIPPEVSPLLSYAISFAFALVFLAVVWLLYRNWQQYMRLNSKKPLGDIARIARASLDDLSAGRNSSDVIINCYLRMSEVVAERRRLRRAEAMTPHEFALRLEQAGLPGEAVTGLTRLFEGVRYGDRRSGPKDVNEAVRCLKTILHYCGEPV
jgi:hypothetical protein